MGVKRVAEDTGDKARSPSSRCIHTPGRLATLLSGGIIVGGPLGPGQLPCVIPPRTAQHTGAGPPQAPGVTVPSVPPNPPGPQLNSSLLSGASSLGLEQGHSSVKSV